MTISDPSVVKQVPSFRVFYVFTSHQSAIHAPSSKSDIFNLSFVSNFSNAKDIGNYGFQHRLLRSRADGERDDFAKKMVIISRYR